MDKDISSYMVKDIFYYYKDDVNISEPEVFSLVLEGVHTKAELLETYARQFKFPSYFTYFMNHVNSSERHTDLNMSPSEMMKNVERFVIENRTFLREGSNTFQGTINGLPKSIIVNVKNGQIRSLNLYPNYSARKTHNPIIYFGNIKWK